MPQRLVWASMDEMQDVSPTACDHVLRLATDSDATSIHARRESLALWQRSRGVEQWKPGEIPLRRIEAQVRRDEWYVLDDDAGALIAAVRIIFGDPVIWTDSDRIAAGYVHGLMVARGRAGEGLGERVLRAAEGIVRDHGAPVVRLDCVASNAMLRRYYESRGYILVGERDFPPSTGWHPVALFQKRIDQADQKSLVGSSSGTDSHRGLAADPQSNPADRAATLRASRSQPPTRSPATD